MKFILNATLATLFFTPILFAVEPAKCLCAHCDCSSEAHCGCLTHDGCKCHSHGDSCGEHCKCDKTVIIQKK